MTHEDLDWLFDNFEGFLMACENEYGGSKEAYREDLARAKDIIDKCRDLIQAKEKGLSA